MSNFINLFLLIYTVQEEFEEVRMDIKSLNQVKSTTEPPKESNPDVDIKNIEALFLNLSQKMDDMQKTSLSDTLNLVFNTNAQLLEDLTTLGD